MANQVTSQPISYQIFGDGTSTSASFDIAAVSLGGNLSPLQSKNPDSIYFLSLGGSPTPLPNVTSLTVSGTTVTVEFDAALALANPISTYGVYELTFIFGFNA